MIDGRSTVHFWASDKLSDGQPCPACWQMPMATAIVEPSGSPQWVIQSTQRMRCMQCSVHGEPFLWSGGGREKQQKHPQRRTPGATEDGQSDHVSVLLEGSDLRQAEISLLNARARFAKRSQDRSGCLDAVVPGHLTWASGLEEGITASHSKGSPPVRGRLEVAAWAQIPHSSLTPFPHEKSPKASQAMRGQTDHKRRTSLAQRRATLEGPTPCTLAYAGSRRLLLVSFRSRFGTPSIFRVDGGLTVPHHA